MLSCGQIKRWQHPFKSSWLREGYSLCDLKESCYVVMKLFEIVVRQHVWLREMVKTIVLRQDPPFLKKTGGLFVYSPSPTLKDGVLFV